MEHLYSCGFNKLDLRNYLHVMRVKDFVVSVCCTVQGLLLRLYFNLQAYLPFEANTMYKRYFFVEISEYLS